AERLHGALPRLRRGHRRGLRGGSDPHAPHGPPAAAPPARGAADDRRPPGAGRAGPGRHGRRPEGPRQRGGPRRRRQGAAGRAPGQPGAAAALPGGGADHRRLQHPGVVPVYGLGRLAAGRPYFTMKLVQGRTLAELLAARTGPGQDRPRLLKVFEQVCQALAYAHARGVIHRDLKPANVMVGAFGEVQVMDWGLAKLLSAAPADAGSEPPADRGDVLPTRCAAGGETQAGAVLGTPGYMAPEQARGEVDTLDARCDVFGLGALLCAILTGQPPFGGDNQAARVWQA